VSVTEFDFSDETYLQDGLQLLSILEHLVMQVLEIELTDRIISGQPPQIQGIVQDMLQLPLWMLKMEGV